MRIFRFAAIILVGTGRALAASCAALMVSVIITVLATCATVTVMGYDVPVFVAAIGWPTAAVVIVAVGVVVKTIIWPVIMDVWRESGGKT